MLTLFSLTTVEGVKFDGADASSATHCVLTWVIPAYDVKGSESAGGSLASAKHQSYELRQCRLLMRR